MAQKPLPPVAPPKPAVKMPTSTAAVISNDTIDAHASMPDFVHAVQDSSGNLIPVLLSDDTAVSGNVQGLSDIESLHDATTSLPDAIDVVAAFGVVMDGRDAYLLGTWSNAGETLTIGRYAGGAVLANGGTTLTISPGSISGAAFQPTDQGLPLYLAATDGSGVTLSAIILKWISERVVQLDTAASGAVTQANIVWPCFQTGDLNKTIRIEGGNTSVARQSRGPQAHMAVIVGRNSPIEVALSGRFATAARGTPTRVTWGTDNSEAIINAGAAAVAGAKRYLWFAGNGAVCCAFALQTAGVGDRSFFTAAVGTWQMAVLGTIWIGANTRGVFTDTAGRRVQKAIVPQRMPGAPPPKRTLIGRKHLKRFMATTEPNVMVTGDSLSTPDPNFQSTAFMDEGLFEGRLREDNPDKTINTILRGIGGSQVGWLASSTPPAARLQFSHAGQPWFTDRTLPWWHYVESAVVNGSTITPDMFFLSFGGYNDTNSLHPLKLQALINRIAALPQRGGLPPDCLLSTCMVKTPGTAYIQDSLGDTQRLLRTMAAHQGLGLIDYDPHSSLQAFGTSTEHVALRLIPGFTADFSPSAPITLNTHCYDYSVQLRLNAANGAVAWKAVGSLTFSLSPQPGNVMIVDTDPATGVLRYEARLWGRAVQTTVTVSGTTLKTSPGTGFTGTLNWIGTTTQCELGPSPGPFTGTVGQCALLPGADTFGGTMRTFVNTVVSDSVAVMDDFLFNVRAAQAGQTRYSSSCEAVIGGMMFVPLDADAQVDVVIPGAGVAGSEYRGKIVGYTDANQVTISPAVSTTLTAASVALFLGRISVPKTTTTIAATTDRGRWAANPIVDFSVQGGRLQLRYQPPRQVNIQGTYRAFIGTVERFGGRFCPTITPSATGPASITVANVFVDDQMLYMPEATPWELHSAGSRYYQYGGGGAHSSSLLAERVATRVLNAQDFAA